MTQAAIGTSEPAGIGGWLILPAIGIVAAPVRFLTNLMDYLQLFDGIKPGTLVHAMLSAEVVCWIGFLILAGVTAVQFFARKVNAPKLYIALLVAQVTFVAADALAAAILFNAQALNTDTEIAFGMLVAACAIWIPYFLYSVRVRNTFVR
jgi:hypothetical protein